MIKRSRMYVLIIMELAMIYDAVCYHRDGSQTRFLLSYIKHRIKSNAARYRKAREVERQCSVLK